MVCPSPGYAISTLTSQLPSDLLHCPPTIKPLNPPVDGSTSPPAGNTILNCDHLVKSIVENTDRNTKVVLLRTSRLFFDAVAPHLYFSISIGGSEGPSLFEGIQEMIDADNEHDAKPSKTSGLPTNPKSSFNFKAALLIQTRIITIQGVHPQWCDMDEYLFHTLFLEVGIVRFAPQWCDPLGNRTSPHPHGTDYACDRKCRFAQLPCVSKVVFRNLAYPSLPFPPAFVPDFNHVEEVVFIMPLKDQFHAEDEDFFPPRQLVGNISPGFNLREADYIKIVIWPELDVRSWSKPQEGGSDENLPYELEEFAGVTHGRLHIYGLEHADLVHPDDGDLEDEDRLERLEKTALKNAKSTIRGARGGGAESRHVKFFTLDKYIKDPEARQGEVMPW
ncbi:uncharacterized protein LOC62_01G001587 [Vanrija pseudolonga]|uniref:Uncharacterized protein n=1 Tax=Vanrija pseudolonga TaxID=143232 RepID=A0AAF0Y4D5_9TREE|nr:hypothetical protein LOC62_01G001587 [Vanrija pseudolonga]